MIVVVNSRMHIPTNRDYILSKHRCLSNPYTHKNIEHIATKYKLATPEEVQSAYKTHLLNKIKARDKQVCKQLNRIYTLALSGDVFLVCHCKPKPCHGDVIKEIVESNIIYDESELLEKKEMLLHKRESIANSIFDVIGNPELVMNFRMKMNMVNGLLEEVEGKLE